MKKLILILVGVFIVLGIVTYFLLVPKPVYAWPGCSSEYDECMRSAAERAWRCYNMCERYERGILEKVCLWNCNQFFQFDFANCHARLICCWTLGLFKFC